MKAPALIAIHAVFGTATLFGQSIDRAALYRQHGLIEDAKRDYIQVLSGRGPQDQKAEALYSLGLIAFDQNRIAVALASWTQLVKEFPSSQQAKEVQDRLKDLSQIIGEQQKETVDNAVAQSYLRHGDFWSRGKDQVFSIDSSFIPNLDAAIKWYDKTVQEFPKSPAARIAYEEKMRAILGWKEPGKYGSSYGIVANPSKYIPILVDTFQAYQADFPESGSLQPFRYQVAQAYWGVKDWSNTRKWLEGIIMNQSKGADSFYVDLANRRLQNLEY
jgi:tetratricopeptide (TPR) repeat protein